MQNVDFLMMQLNFLNFVYIPGIHENDGPKQLASLDGMVYQVSCLYAGYCSHHAAVLQYPYQPGTGDREYQSHCDVSVPHAVCCQHHFILLCRQYFLF